MYSISSESRLRTEFAKHLALLLTATLILWSAAALISYFLVLVWCGFHPITFFQALWLILPYWGIFPILNRILPGDIGDRSPVPVPGRRSIQRLLVLFLFFGAFLFWTGVRNCRTVLRLLRITPARIAEAVETLQAADGQPLSVPKLAAIHDMTADDLLFAFDELRLGTPLFRNTEIALKDQWRLRQTPGETPN